MAPRTDVHVIWLGAGGCDGCTMATLGATTPRLEELLAGGLTTRRLVLHHAALALDAGAAYLEALERAARGGLGPLVLVVEGALFDQRRAGAGTFSRLGTRDGRPVPAETWAARLAARAEAVVAVGTCATWGGVPAAAGSVTGAMGVGAFLGEDFRSRSGLPVVNVPGCAVSGDGFIETLQYLLLHLGGTVPLDLDEHDRPRWLFSQSSPLGSGEPGAAGSADAAAEATTGDAPTAPCPVPARGWINRLGGCRTVGGTCTGCTLPAFPDRTLPLVHAGAGSKT